MITPIVSVICALACWVTKMHWRHSLLHRIHEAVKPLLAHGVQVFILIRFRVYFVEDRPLVKGIEGALRAASWPD